MNTSPDPLALGVEFDSANREHWLKLVEKVLKGADFDKRLVARTYDGLKIAPLYTRADSAGLDPPPALGMAPFTRGGARSTAGTWDIRQRHAETDPAKANAAILEDLEGGVTSLTLQCEAPGQFGLPTEPEAFARALENVYLDLVPISLDAGERVGDAAVSLMALWNRGLPEDKRLGAFNADPLGSLAKVGALDTPLPQTVAGMVDLAMPMPGVTALLADGRPYHAAGASEAQELAAMLASLVTYLRTLDAKGIAPEKALSKIAVALAVDADQFLGLAKLRAARKLIWRVAEACGAGEAAGQVPIIAETAWRMMAERDPSVNLLRTAIACSAAAMGGANAITVLPFTHALGKPDAFARRIARNTQIVLMEESALGRVADPAGGSWYVESLTEELARKAWELFQAIEGQTAGAQRGMLAALASGYIHDAIAKTADARRKNLATAREELTGVSAFPRLGDDGIKVAAYPPVNVDPPRGGKIKPLKVERLAAPFEALRDRADAFAKTSGAPPKIFLATLGALGDFSARATWARNFFAAGGIAAVGGEPYTSREAAATAFRASGANLACLCASDAVYGSMAEPAAAALKAAGAAAVYLAGRPGEQMAELEAAGVGGFVHVGVNMVEVLGAVLGRLGSTA